MAKTKQAPNDLPSWNSIMQKADKKERDEMNLINREFGFGTFVGCVVANWCEVCGKWKMHYVPKAKEEEVDGFESSETFPCTKCGTKLALLKDDKHIILRNA